MCAHSSLDEQPNLSKANYSKCSNPLLELCPSCVDVSIRWFWKERKDVKFNFMLELLNFLCSSPAPNSHVEREKGTAAPKEVVLTSKHSCSNPVVQKVKGVSETCVEWDGEKSSHNKFIILD